MARSSKQPFEVGDFSQGITDDAFEGDPRYSIELDNFVIQPDASLYSREGSLIDDETNDQIPSGVKRIGGLINYDNSTKLFVQSEQNIYYRNPSAYATLEGPTSNPVFSVGTETNNIAFSEWNKQVFVTNDGFPRPMKFYKNSSGDYKVNNSGLPALATAPTVTPGAGANTYIYAFHHYFTYTVGSQTFEDVGPVTFVTTSSAAAPNVTPIAITNIPVLSNGATDNYATTTIKIHIYRTIAAGAVFYKAGEVTNGTTTFNDSMSDATLQVQLLMYTEDGTVEFDPVPLHKFVHIVNGIGYYGFIREASVDYPFTIRQSIPFNPSGCPADFSIDVEDSVRGIGSVNSLPMAFCNRHVYRLDGNFDQFGRGGITPVRVSDTAGCISHLSIVSAEGKIFWAGTDGFYTSDGYKVQKITDKLNSRYRQMVNESDDTNRIVGRFDRQNRRIVWALQSDASSQENDTIFVLELRWEIRENSSFTTWSGTSFRPSAIEFFNDILYRADDSGYVFYSDPETRTDPRVDTNEEAADWELETIIWDYKSTNYNFGGNFFRKMPTRLLLVARNVANTSIQITSIDDDGKRERDLKIIRWRRNLVWGDPNFIWGDPDCRWNSLGIIEQWRRFPARGLRVSYCQIRITNGYSVIANSDLFGTAIFDGTLNTATLSSGADWPSDAVDYFISTEVDNYERQFKVTSKTATVLTLVDFADVLPTGTYKWLLNGYRKNEPLNLQGYTIHVANVDQNQLTNETGDDGANQ